MINEEYYDITAVKIYCNSRRKGTFSKAAKSLFLSQPSLTKAIKELEKEMGVVIFDRTNKGVSVSKEGEIFLGYARQVLEQATLLEEKYKTQAGGKQEFRVSTQHSRLLSMLLSI